MSIFKMYTLHHNIGDCFLKAIVTSGGNISPGIDKKLANATSILIITVGDRYLKELETDKRELLTWIKANIELRRKRPSVCITFNRCQQVTWHIVEEL